ncbi:hypothetical protein EDB84DRAFT_1504257, partial [Lactarius hengduanensis]
LRPTRYDLHSQKVTQMSREQNWKFDVREEYFKLSATSEEDWETERIERPKACRMGRCASAAA